MERRTALKSLAISIWGIMLLPGCGTGLEENALPEVKLLPLNALQKANLQSLVDTLIPKTDTLGAVELEVHGFVDRILANCHELEVQNKFIQGLSKLESKSQMMFKTSYNALEKPERELVLIGLDNAELEADKEFFDLAKELTVLGYTTSEYFLTNFTNYQMVPGGYDGCVAVPNTPFKI
ncbi:MULTISPECIES: gluconate 2-dehydrogenase subunit 3 family protein [Rhodonellum]|nr:MULTISPECIES: gluconate 2-dehydrogenase subunit 3 family protein [Rhodonellum]